MTTNLKVYRNLKNNFSIYSLCPFLYSFLGLLAISRHALWRDEMQGWLVAWRSNNLVELWQSNAPSGHPVLWSALIYFSKHITNSPLSMQLLHWFLATVAISFFWIWNPLPKFQKSMFIFGYFPFWEYFIISRQYVLAELLLFAFCASYPIRSKSYLPSALIVGLLINSHAFSWSIAFAIISTLLFDWFYNKSQRINYKSQRFWIFDLTLSLIILSGFFIFAFYSLFPSHQSIDITSNTYNLRHLFRVIGRIFGGYVLVVPDSSRWIDLIITSIITAIFIFGTLSFVSKSRSALVFFISGVLSLSLFNYFIYLGVGSRHYGFYYMIIICSIWLTIDECKGINLNLINSKNNFLIRSFFIKNFSRFLTFCLAIHLAAGLHRTAYDFYIPYSAGKATASYVKEKGWDQLPIWGTRDVELSTISGYLDKDIYYPEVAGLGSYTQWSKRKNIPRESTLIYLDLFLSQNPSINNFLIILSKRSSIKNLEEGDTLYRGDVEITLEKKFERSWTVPERYHLYTVNKVNR